MKLSLIPGVNDNPLGGCISPTVDGEVKTFDFLGTSISLELIAMLFPLKAESDGLP